MTADRAGHRLDKLLAPRSIALVGASNRPESTGLHMVQMARAGGYGGAVYPVNPNYDLVDRLPCFPALEDLPECVDHVVLGVANERLEGALEAAIDHGAGAATIFASCHLDGESGTALAARLRNQARNAGLALCGGNCMGFYNVLAGLRVVGYPSPSDMPAGGVTWITQSGSSFGALAHNDRRLRFNLCVSSGAEFTTTVADYLDWSLAQDSTTAIGLFLETVRDPAGFLTALETAAERSVPVVVLKVGRTAMSAAMAATHTGAMVGNDAAYRAVFERYGVLEVETLDELAATLLMFQQPRRATPGGLATIHDSGGEREMVADLADDLGVPFAAISAATKAKLAARLEPGLKPENPLDAWGTGHDFEGVFEDCLSALLDDPDTALGVFFYDLRDDYYLAAGFSGAAIAAAAKTGKPVAIATNYSLVRHRAIARRVTEAGVPVIDGTKEALIAVRHMLAFRDVHARQTTAPGVLVAPEVAARWRARLRAGAALSQAEGLCLLSDYGIAVPRFAVAESRDAIVAAARDFGGPVVLKSAAPGLQHKTEADGVRLGLADREQVTAAYDDLSRRLGPAVMISQMAEPGVELGLGAVNDPMFGPFVMAAAGGVLIEVLDDSAVALAPLDTERARRMIRRLRVSRLLDGVRGRPAAEVASLAETLVRLSVLAVDLSDEIAEIDINPVIVGPRGCVAVDALVIPQRADDRKA